MWEFQWMLFSWSDAFFTHLSTFRKKSATQSALIEWKPRAWVTYLLRKDGWISQSKVLQALSVFKQGQGQKTRTRSLTWRELLCAITERNIIKDKRWILFTFSLDVNWYGFTPRQMKSCSTGGLMNKMLMVGFHFWMDTWYDIIWYTIWFPISHPAGMKFPNRWKVAP